MTELSTMQLHSIFGFILFFLLVWQVIHAIFSWQQYWRESSFEKLQTNKQTNVLFSAGSCASMSTLNPPFTDFILAFTNLHYLTNVVRCQLLIGKNESIINWGSAAQQYTIMDEAIFTALFLICTSCVLQTRS